MIAISKENNGSKDMIIAQYSHVQKPKSFIQGVLHHVAGETDTRDLVVCVYLSAKSQWTGGIACVRSWQTQKCFTAVRGKWRFIKDFPIPEGMPDRFKLIRLRLIDNPRRYPLRERDIYDWEHRFHRFEDHLAFLFAHELHHYRRYHLGLHPREGEQSANRWALEKLEELGYLVDSVRIRKKRRQQRFPLAAFINPFDFVRQQDALSHSFKSHLYRIFSQLDGHKEQKIVRDKLEHFERLRMQDPGTDLRIVYDPEGGYTGQRAELIRPLRRNSYRIVIKTGDGKEWRWPMAWLELENRI